MSNSYDNYKSEPSGKAKSVYAKGFNPDTDEDWYDDSREKLGGDDFTIFIPLDWYDVTIDKLDYALLLRRFQRNMIALMAIEQLTGVVKTPPVVVSLESLAETSNSLLEPQKNINKIDDEIAKINTKIKILPSVTEDDNATIGSLKERITSFETLKTSFTDSMKDAKNNMAEGSIKTKIGNISSSKTKLDANITSNLQIIKAQEV